MAANFGRSRLFRRPGPAESRLRAECPPHKSQTRQAICVAYSTRSATMGSIREALRAGK